MTDRAWGAEVVLEPDANYWEIRFRARYPAGRVLGELVAVLPPGLTLYLEGTSIAPIVAGYLAERPEPHTSRVRRGVIWPRPNAFHMPLTPENVAGLVELANHVAAPEIADHVHAYTGKTAYVIWHDAWFDSPLYLLDSVAEDAVRHLCDEIGGEFARYAD